MAKLTSAERKALPKSDFLVPSKAPGPGSFPVPDKKHLAVAQGYAKKSEAAGNISHATEQKIVSTAKAREHRSYHGDGSNHWSGR